MATKQYSCVKRTKKAFEVSLAHLAKEYPLNKVTVIMLCERAELSRNAFYFHYKDINNLIEEIENNLIDEATALTKEFEALGFPENVLAFNLYACISLHTCTGRNKLTDNNIFLKSEKMVNLTTNSSLCKRSCCFLEGSSR